MASCPTAIRSTAIFGRRTFVISASLALAAGRAPAACPAPRVLFVCPAGSVKSAIAREALRRRAAAQGVAVSVSSRGVHPEDHVTPALAANLRRDGLNPAAEPLRELTPPDIAQADLVIAFDAAAQEPILRGARAWNTPSWNTDYAAARTDLDLRLIQLMTEIGTWSAQPCSETHPSNGDQDD